MHEPQHGAVRRLEVGRDVEPGDGRAVAQAAVGHHAGPPAREHACDEDVADRAGPGVLACLDDERLARLDRLDGGLLRVERSLVRVADVLAQRDVAQRPRVADQAEVRPRRVHAADPRVAHAAPLELLRERRGADAVQHLPRLGRELVRARRGLAGRPRTHLGRDLRPRAPGLDVVIGLDDRAAHAARALELDLDDVADIQHARAGRRAGEDDVARLERDEARDVRDEVGEGEDQVGRDVLLDDLAVDARAEHEPLRVDLGGGHGRADRREAVLALGEEVGAAVVPAEVGDPGVVGGGEPADVRERVLGRDAMRARADHHGDLALVPEQLGAAGADEVSVAGQRGRRLEEVGGYGRRAPALGRPAAVVQVDGDDLGGRQACWQGHRRDHIWFPITHQREAP